jgi:hypothetical protein
MIVDVLYEGLTLHTGAQAREEADGTFIELDAPMPVGTRLMVRSPEGERAARVERVREGIGAGMLVKFVEGSTTGEHEAIDDGSGEKKKKKKKKGH